jgi:hypothetical protein
MKYLLDTDHISFLQRPNCKEFNALNLRMSQHLLRILLSQLLVFMNR